MNPQTLAEGIHISYDADDLKMYTVTCKCMSDSHIHQICVSSDGHTGEQSADITVSICTTQFVHSYACLQCIKVGDHVFINWPLAFLSSTWKKLKFTWELWTTGSIETQVDTLLTEQCALNYANAITMAIADMKENKHNETRIDQ